MGGDNIWIKLYRGNKYVIQASELHGCKFPGSPCHTQTMTDGNAPCSLIKFIFQYVPATRSHWLPYIQDETIQRDGIHYNSK